MIWTPTPEPCIGEQRVIQRFAWFPVTLVTGDRLWLERYYALEEYTRDASTMEEEHWWRTIARTTKDPSEILAAPCSCASIGQGAACNRCAHQGAR